MFLIKKGFEFGKKILRNGLLIFHRLERFRGKDSLFNIENTFTEIKGIANRLPLIRVLIEGWSRDS